jgi:hypothetical protein
VDFYWFGASGSALTACCHDAAQRIPRSRKRYTTSNLRAFEVEINKLAKVPCCHFCTR